MQHSSSTPKKQFSQVALTTECAGIHGPFHRVGLRTSSARSGYATLTTAASYKQGGTWAIPANCRIFNPELTRASWPRQLAAPPDLSLIHISEPTRLRRISY